MPELIVYPTKDQSNTLFHPELDETYHSRNGALQESLHVFIDAGLKFAAEHKHQLRILEVGFGTGLNAILTYDAASKLNLEVAYHALETYPLPASVIQSLEYDKILNDENLYNQFMKMHACTWNEPVHINASFSLCKHETSLQQFESDQPFDLIYFDAFAPDKQPELWQPDMISKLFAMQPTGGVWVTYSSKGEVKRNLRAAGYVVERLPGPPFKRHMLRAVKP